MKIVPYLIFDGNAREAVDFYTKALGAEVLGIMSFSEMPSDPNNPIPDEAKDRVAHAMIRIGEEELMFSDTFPGQPFQVGSNITICIVTKDTKQTKEVFDALADGGKVEMPLQKTFWSPLYGVVTDKFGVNFQVTTDHEEQQ